VRGILINFAPLSFGLPRLNFLTVARDWVCEGTDAKRWGKKATQNNAHGPRRARQSARVPCRPEGVRAPQAKPT